MKTDNNARVIPVFLLITAMLLLAGFTGCSAPPAEISAQLGETVELRIGQTVVIEGEEMTVRFAGIIGDSRCPTGATCIWQGEVTGTLEINVLGESYEKTFTQPGLSGEMVTVAFGEYVIGYNVLPYPKVDKEIKRDDYWLELMINKVVSS